MSGLVRIYRLFCLQITRICTELLSMQKALVALIISTWVVSAHAAAEGPQTFTIDGRLFQSTALNAPALLDSGVIKVQVLSPDATCILYEEAQAFNTSTSDGYFSLLVGSVTGAPKRTASDSGNGMATVFSNTIISGISGKLTADGSTNCTYNPASSAARAIRIQVTPVSDGLTRTLSPDLVMNAVPGAMVAERAETLQGILPSSLLQLGTGSTTQSNIDNVFSAINYPRLTDLLSVGTGSYVRESANGAALAPTVAGDATTPSAGQFWYDTTANQLKFYNGSAVRTVGTVSSASDLSAGTIGGTVAMNTSGNIVTTGNITGQNVFAGQVNANFLRMADGQGTPKYIEFKAPASIGAVNLTYTWPAAFPGSNMVLQSDNAGTLSWVAPGGGGVGDLLANGTIPLTADWDINGATAGGTRKITGLDVASVSDGAVSKAQLDSAISTAAGAYVTKDGLTGLTGNWDANGATAGGTRLITGLDVPAVSDGAATKGYVDSAITTVGGRILGSVLAAPTASEVNKSIRWNALGTAWEYYSPSTGSGDLLSNGSVAMSADWDLNGATAGGTRKITGLDVPTVADGAASKSYVDANLRGSALATPVGQAGKSIRWNAGDTAWEYFTPSSGDALLSGKLSQFAATSSSELFGVLSDETGSGVGGFAVFSSSPVITTPTLRAFTLGGSTSGGITMQVAATGAAGTYTWPSAVPGSNMVLQSDNTGALSWVAAGGGAGDLLANGTVPMTAPLQASTGSAAAPSLTFDGDEDTGFFNYAANGISVVTNGAEKVRFGNNGSINAVTAYYSLGSSNTEASPVFSFVSDSNTGMFQAAADTLAFSTNSTEKMRIEAGGNIGIGDQSPDAKLDIQGTLGLSGATSGTITFAAPATVTSGTYVWPAAMPGSNMVLQSDNTGALSWVAGGGSVGADSLNFTDFSDTLALDASTSITAPSGQAYALSVVNEGTGNSFFVGDEAADATPFVIDAAGNVGIGSTSPAYKLQVDETTTATSGTARAISSVLTVTPSADGNVTAIGARAGLTTSGAFDLSGAYGTVGQVDIDGSAGQGVGFAVASRNVVSIKATSAADVSNAIAGQFLASNLASVTVTKISGIETTLNNSSTGTVSTAVGMVARLTNASTGTITDGIGLETSLQNSGGGTVSTYKGLYINGIPATNSNYYSVYADGAAKSYFGGSVGIGTSAPGEKLEVSGNVKATSFISTSDERLKDNVHPTAGLDIILKLTGVDWTWKSDGKHDAGVIAQNVEEVMPHAVVTDVASGMKAVKYNSLIAPLIESTKELYGICVASEERIQEQDRTIASLKKENAEIKERLERIEKMLLEKK